MGKVEESIFTGRWKSLLSRLQATVDSPALGLHRGDRPIATLL